MKFGLICNVKKVSAKTIAKYKKNMKYDKVFFICNECSVEDEVLKKEKKIEVFISTEKGIFKTINEIFEKHEKKYLLFPKFTGDKNSKYAIRVYNKSFDTKINHKIFRDKKAMNAFVADRIDKKNETFSYDELQKNSYEDLKEKVGDSFIVKPVSSSASVMSSKVASPEDLSELQPKLKKKFKYILEEYISGNLYSVDFYFDGKNIFLLCYAREVCLAEILDKLPSVKKQIGHDIYTPEFLHFVATRYTIDLNKLSKLELDFIKELSKNLEKINYRGIIHLEYKLDKKHKKIGFIEWGARAGGYRAFFIKEMHNIDLENLPYYLLGKKDYGKFIKKKDIYFLRGRDENKNFVGIRTNILKKTHVMDILKKNTSNYLEVSFQKFMKDFLWDNWRIKVKNVRFFVKTSSNYFLYPFYERGDTRFDYMMEMDETNYKKFLTKKHPLTECLTLHDYDGELFKKDNTPKEDL